jgi:DNA-binding response OmpR family regulator
MSKVMIVDDEQAIAEGLKAFFELDGFEVRTVSGGGAAQGAARDWLPDVIILDIMMPGLNGWQVLKALKEDAATKSIPVVMSSVMEKEEDVNRSISLGAAEYVVKTIDPEKIVEKIKTLLSRGK